VRAQQHNGWKGFEGVATVADHGTVLVQHTQAHVATRPSLLNTFTFSRYSLFKTFSCLTPVLLSLIQQILPFFQFLLRYIANGQGRRASCPSASTSGKLPFGLNN
jgi:hypothetical protein